jgi:hypothetical protein
VAHTPGKWTADWDDNGQWYVNIGGLSVSGNALRGDSGECVERANAYLIARAPELLKALKQCIEDNPVFRSKPVGAPGSPARLEQDLRIENEDRWKDIISEIEAA